MSKPTEKDIKKEWREAMICYAIMVGLFYVAAAMLTFQFRHPWMTDTERCFYVGKALTFQKVHEPEKR